MFRTPRSTAPYLLSTAFILAGCGAGQPGDQGDSWTATREVRDGRVKVLYVPSSGFAYRDETGRLTGVTVEIMREFTRYMGQVHGVSLELDFVEERDWRRFYERVRLARGGVFGLGNVTITDERRRELRFSPSYLTNVAVLITHRDVRELPSLDEIGEAFAGLRPLAFEGTLHEARVQAIRDRAFPYADIAYAHANDDIVRRIGARPEYFTYIDIYNYWRAREEGAPLRQHPVADEASEDFGIIMPLDSDWQPVLEAFFESEGGLREREVYRHILETHLGPELASLLETARRGGGR